MKELTLYRINFEATKFEKGFISKNDLNTDFDEKLKSLSEKGYTDVLDITKNKEYFDNDQRVVGGIGRVINKVPNNMMDMFKKIFKDTQRVMYSHEEFLKNYQCGMFEDPDDADFAEEFQCSLSPYAIIKEGFWDKNNLDFEYSMASNNEEIEKFGLDVIFSVSKEEFWSDNFAKKYPGMKYFKMATSNALNTASKNGIPMEKVNKVEVDCKVSLMLDIDRLSDFTVFEVYSPGYKYNRERMQWDLIEGEYDVNYILVADYRKNPMCMEAMRLKALSQVKDSTARSILSKTPFNVVLDESNCSVPGIFDKNLIKRDGDRWKK